MCDYLNQLNSQQREAVEYLDSPQLVIAGAGSGKTRVITYKIVHLLAKGYQPWRIMALTFTNKAAREMKERITQVMGEALTSRLWMGTFHSIFLRILRRHYDKIGYNAGFTIYDTSDSKNLIKSIIKQMELDDKVYKPGIVQSAISMAKTALVSPDDYASNRELLELDSRSKKPLIYAIYRTYQHRCRINNAMDFDDILYYMNILLTENPDILNHYREFFQYILVDEFQDVNLVQNRIVKLLTEGQSNLSVVGDDAQSIYSFRGANISNILNLKQFFPDLKVFKLERNYRSTKNIIGAANSLLEKNQNQIPKQIFSENESGELIEVIQCCSDYEEGYLIANKISQQKLLQHDSYSDYAVLYRTNAQSRILEESLRKRNIPYKIYGGQSFYQRKEVKDIVAYLKLAINPHDDEALRRIINYPARGIGDTTLNKLIGLSIREEISLWGIIEEIENRDKEINSAAKKRLTAFKELIESFIDLNRNGENALDLTKHIVNKTQILSNLLNDRTPESISKQQNIHELINGVRLFVESKEEEGIPEEATLGQFLSEVSLATDMDEKDSNNTSEAVTMMTVHAAKGLEFKNVYIVGLEEDLFPSSLSYGSQNELEEERRLLYVAITRAKKNCILSFAKSRYRNGQEVISRPSRFLNEIDAEFIKSKGGFKTTDLYRSVGINPVDNYKRRFRKNDTVNSHINHNIKTASSPVYSKLDKTAALSSQTGVSYTFDEVESGMRIEHPRHGKGIIIKKERVDNNDRIVVKFDNGDVRTVILKYARFRII